MRNNLPRGYFSRRPAGDGKAVVAKFGFDAEVGHRFVFAEHKVSKDIVALHDVGRELNDRFAKVIERCGACVDPLCILTAHAGKLHSDPNMYNGRNRKQEGNAKHGNVSPRCAET